MRNYNQQIEDAYAVSKRQGDLMRDREIERSSGQDRRNRYRDDRYQFPEQHRPFDPYSQGEAERVDRYGYERSTLYNSALAQRERLSDSGGQRENYIDTYRSALGGYMSEYVGDDRGRQDYNRNYNAGGNLYGNHYGPHRGKGPKNYKRSDERVKEDVIMKLTDDPYVDASEIEITVQSCEVTLMGTVNDRDEKRRAEDLAESVSGVINVENRIKVKSSHDASRSNENRSEIEIRSVATA